MNRIRMMNDAKFLPVVALGLLLAACSAESDLPDTPQEGNHPIGFSTTIEEEAAETRSSLTADNLRSMSVFAYYTEGSNWTTSHKPNFMFNEKVTRIGSTAPWTYSPVKYWPNNPNDKLSFFAYAPHTDDCSVISISTTNTQAGYPEITCTVPASESAQRDVLVAQPIMNNTNTVASLKFTFRHMLAKMVFQVKSSSAIDVTGLKLTSMGTQFKMKLDGTSAPTRVGSSTINLVAKASATSPVAVAMNATTPVATFFSGGFVGTGSKIQLSYKQSGAAASTAVTEEVDFPAGDFFWDSTKGQAKHALFTLTVNGEADLIVSTVNIKEDWPTTDTGNGSITTPVF